MLAGRISYLSPVHAFQDIQRLGLFGKAAHNDHFRCREKPFGVAPDPRVFYTNSCDQEARATLLCRIHARRGVIVSTGEVETGTTTLLRRLMEYKDMAMLLERGDHGHHRFDKPEAPGLVGAKAPFAPEDPWADRPLSCVIRRVHPDTAYEGLQPLTPLEDLSAGPFGLGYPTALAILKQPFHLPPDWPYIAAVQIAETATDRAYVERNISPIGGRLRARGWNYTIVFKSKQLLNLLVNSKSLVFSTQCRCLV
jgi:hypothetical protein